MIKNLKIGIRKTISVALSLLMLLGISALALGEEVVSDTTSNMSSNAKNEALPYLDEELEEQMRADYLKFLMNKYPEDSTIQNLPFEDIEIEKYFGSHSGCEIVAINITSFGKSTAIRYIIAAGYSFFFPTIQSADLLYAYKDSEFVTFYEAYETGKLTEEDIYQIGVLRGDIPTLDQFTDLTDGAWYTNAVSYVVGQCLYAGMDDTTFEPSTPMTRAMFVTVLAKLAQKIGEEIDIGDDGFSDVDTKAWYAKPVGWAAAKGIVSGYDEAHFGPNDSITREQMMVMFVSFANYMDLELNSNADFDGFNDAASVSSWAVDAVRKSGAAGLISGYPDGTFKPQETATRSEVSAVFMNFSKPYLSLIVDDDYFKITN